MIENYNKNDYIRPQEIIHKTFQQEMDRKLGPLLKDAENFNNGLR